MIESTIINGRIDKKKKSVLCYVIVISENVPVMNANA